MTDQRERAIQAALEAARCNPQFPGYEEAEMLVRDAIEAYERALPQSDEGVTDEVVEEVCRAVGMAGTMQQARKQVRRILESVWPRTEGLSEEERRIVLRTIEGAAKNDVPGSTSHILRWRAHRKLSREGEGS